MQIIPYNPQTDPKQYLAQALQQGLSGYLAHRQKQQFQKGLSPTMTPMQLLQKALQAGYPMQEALGMARLTPTPKPTEIQKLRNEGYSPEEARMIRDISHGLKPRASSRKHYDNMSDVEKLNFLSTLKQRAEGQYFGIDPELGGLREPRQPKLLKWVDEELSKLSILQTGKSQEPAIGELPVPKVGDAVRYSIKTGKPTAWLGPEGVVDKPLKTATKGKIGDVVSKGGRKWKIVGFDKDGEPLVEEVR